MKFVKSILQLGKKYIKRRAYNIALTGTENYIPWIGVVMASIMEHNNNSFSFHILVDKTNDEDIFKLTAFSDQWHVPITVYYMNDEVLSIYSKFDRYFINGRYIPTLVYRFVVPDVIPENVSRVLYLDGDIVCNGNITDFMDINLKGNIVAVSEDRRGCEFANRINVKQYFNAGIILIDAIEWRKRGYTNQFLEEMKKQCTEHPNLPCADQDILNKFLSEKALFVSRKYNSPYRLVQPSVFKPKIINEDPMKASLIHFIGAIKPWTTYNQSVPIVKIWAHAKENSPWREVRIHEPNSQKAFHQAARDARRRKAYGEMVGWYIRFLKSKFDGTRKVGY